MTWTVRYIDYPAAFRKIEREVMETIHTVLANGDLMLRQQLRDFEENLARFCGAKYAVGVSNCTDAPPLSLRSARSTMAGRAARWALRAASASTPRSCWARTATAARW